MGTKTKWRPFVVLNTLMPQSFSLTMANATTSCTVSLSVDDPEVSYEALEVYPLAGGDQHYRSADVSFAYWISQSLHLLEV